MVAAGARVKFQIGSRLVPEGPIRPTRVPRTRVLRLPEVSEAGYEAVAGLQDVAAMKAFIQRAAQQAGGRVEDCGWLDALAASHAGAPAGLAALLEELTVCISPPSLPREVGGGPGALPEPDSLEGPALLHMDPGLLPLSPASGSCRGGATLRWAGAGPPPRCVLVDGWACAELAGGLFVVPLCRSCPPEAEAPVLVDVAVVLQDGQGILFEGAFAYWVPGRVLAVEPPHGAPAGGDWVRVTTSSLAAPITAVRIAGQACELSAGASEAEAVVLVPPRRTEGRARLEGAVMVEVVAANGNGAALEAGFVYRQPEAFGLVGDRVDLSHGSTAATRRDGVCGGVLLGAFPARRVAGGRYFELRVDAVCKSTRTLAVGFTACRPGEVAAANGRVRAEEARELERAWLVGYERRGALLLCDGREFPVPPSCWRPKSQVAAGARIGVLWAEGQAGDQPPALCIFQDGEERARLPVGGRLPEPGEDIFALVDLQGSVKGVSLVEGAMPPAPAGTISTASTGS
ncbi:unnamed protein product [Prorocentrum cordatum]|uniref:NHR domain-containing protein n=1 Tax=Prorocentrum cordatum TaxID=2364126 RepID=A0ABN9XZV9_9DINO|nr:unnamed protein product [Polarella glacialis]